MDLIKMLNDIDDATRFKAKRNMVNKFKSLFGKNARETDEFDYNNIDDIVRIISNAKKTDAYIARTLTSILQKSLKNGWYFQCDDQNKAARIEKRFNKLLLNSNMNPRSFIRDVLKTYIDYSNVFIYKSYKRLDKRKKDKEIHSLTLFPTKGWEVYETVGPLVTKWQYNFSSKEYQYSDEEIYQLYYNKEIHETFGTPFLLSVLEDIQLLRDIEAGAIEDFENQSNKKTIVYVGTDTQPGTDKEIKELSKYLDSVGPDEDLVLSKRCKVELLEPQYNEPTDLISNMKSRIIAGLMASETQMGISGAGRQDADTQASREMVTVEDFQENLEDQLNNTLIRELCLEEFGKYDDKNCVFIKFGREFTQTEKTNNHYLNLYQTGAIDFNELREKMELPVEKYDESKSFLTRKQNLDKDLTNNSHKNNKEINEMQIKASKETAEFAAKNALQLAKISAQSKASSSSSSSATAKKTTTPKASTTTKKATTTKTSGASNTVKQRATPTNQHGTKSTSKKSTKDEDEK